MKNKFLKFIQFSVYKICIILISLFWVFSVNAGNSKFSFKPDSLNLHPKRFRNVLICEGIAYVGSLSILNEFWYKEYPRSSFHLFNDNAEWLQWGFSIGDFAANTLGAALAVGQELAWNEQRIMLKWTYHSTKYSKYRPNLLGKDLTQTWLKDYNGQTCWLSVNLASFLKQNSNFPKWLNISAGYGAEGMIGAFKNPTIYNGAIMPDFVRYRKFYLSPDIDFTKIKTKSKFLKKVLISLNFIKFPSPALEF